MTASTLNRSITFCLVIFSCNLFAQNNKVLKLTPHSFFAPKKLGDVTLFHDQSEFHVSKNKKLHIVKKYWIDRELRDITSEKLKSFLEKGYVSINQMEDGEYILKAKVRANGGGPLLGSLLYALTKTACYGTAVAATGALAVTTGGAAGAAAGILTASTTLGAGSAVSLTAAAISGAGGATAAAELTTGVIMASGSLAGAVAAVETASVMAYGLGTLVWFLP